MTTLHAASAAVGQAPAAPAREKRFADPVRHVPDPAEYQSVPQIITDVSPSAPATAPTPTASPTRYGLPSAAYERAWDIATIRSYLGIGSTQAYALANDPTFPPRLRTGRAHRWNGLQVMAWLHHHDWHAVDLPEATTAEATEPANGSATGSAHRARVAAAQIYQDGHLRVVPMISRHRAGGDLSRAQPGSAADAADHAASELAPRRHVINPEDIHRQAIGERLAAITGGGPNSRSHSDRLASATKKKNRHEPHTTARPQAQ